MKTTEECDRLAKDTLFEYTQKCGAETQAEILSAISQFIFAAIHCYEVTASHNADDDQGRGVTA